MVFFIEHPNFDTIKKRKLMAFIVVILTAPWVPLIREMFLGLLNLEPIPNIKIGLIIGITALFGAYGLWSKQWF